MSKEPERGNDARGEDPKFETAANSRAAWVLLGGLGGALALLLVVELLRRM